MGSVEENNPNLKVGLLFKIGLKSKVTEKGVCLLSLNDSVKCSTECTRHDKWIVVAGNSYNVDLEKYTKNSLNSENEDKEERQRVLCQCSNPHKSTGSPGKKILKQYVLPSNIVEMHLDSVFRDKTAILSLEVFKCVNMRVLSLRHNNMMCLPVELGRLSQLRTLILTENCLTFNAIPYTLTFCRQLTELYLDHNLLDALPGFLLDMPQLETVYRHGNDNYFKSTFLWYHTAERERVMPIRGNPKNESTLYQPESLAANAVKSLIAAKINFFTPGLLPVTLQNYVSQVYTKYRICAFCSAAFHQSRAGFKVFTFKNPYLGNTCVPFEHWTCSGLCGLALEVPAHKQERAQAEKLDKQYQQYIKSVEEQFRQKPPDKRLASCILM